MTITAAKLQAEVGADTTGFDRGMTHADQRVTKSAGFWKTSLSTAVGVGLERAATTVVRGVLGQVEAGVTSLRALGVVEAQTASVIKSTGGAANVTAGQIRDLSNATEDKTAIDDKAVQAGANMLLTFTNIRNEVGAGNDIFNQSVSILADMSTAMGTDMSSGAIQLGKALNDPLAGITALTRVGVTFSQQQKDQIANFEKAGKTAEAQKVILRELSKEFGGSGAAFAATDAGQAARFQDAIEGIQQSLAIGLEPAITRVRGALDSFLRDPATLGQAKALGDALAGIFSQGNLKTAAGLMTTAAHAVSEAIHLFASLPPQVQALAVGAVALNKITGISPADLVGGAKGIGQFLGRGSSPANALWVQSATGGVGAGGVGGTIASLATKVIIVGLAAEAAMEISKALGLGYNPDPTQRVPGDELEWPFGPKNTPHLDLGPFKDILGGDSFLHPNTPNNSLGGVAGQLGKYLTDPANQQEIAATQLQAAAGDLSIAAGQLSHIGGAAGVRGRSLAKGLHPTDAAVEHTLQRDLQHSAQVVLKSAETTDGKIADLTMIATQGDSKTRRIIGTEIGQLRDAVAGKLVMLQGDTRSEMAKIRQSINAITTDVTLTIDANVLAHVLLRLGAVRQA